MSVIVEKKIVPSSGTYLCSMQGPMCRISTLGGKSPPGKKGIKLRRIEKWLCMARHEASSGYMADNLNSRSRRKDQEGKTNS